MTGLTPIFVPRTPRPRARRRASKALLFATLAATTPLSALAAEPAVSRPSTSRTHEDDDESSGNTTAVSIAFGVGAVGLVVAGASAALMLAKREELRDECGSVRACPESSQSDVNAYRTYGTVSAVSLGVGVAGALTGFSLLLIGSDDSDDEAEHAQKPRVAAAVAANFAGFRGSF